MNTKQKNYYEDYLASHHETQREQLKVNTDVSPVDGQLFKFIEVHHSGVERIRYGFFAHLNHVRGYCKGMVNNDWGKDSDPVMRVIAEDFHLEREIVEQTENGQEKIGQHGEMKADFFGNVYKTQLMKSEHHGLIARKVWDVHYGRRCYYFVYVPKDGLTITYIDDEKNR